MLWALIALVFAGLQTAEVQAQSDLNAEEQEIRDLMDERDKEIKVLLGPEGTEYTDDQRQQLKEIINGIIDFRMMARETLESTYDTISTDLRDEYVTLFSTIVRDNSLNKLDIYRADVRYELIEAEDGQARVETLAQLEDVRTPVYYEMIKTDGEWKITDIIIDDVSTADSYNRQFQRIIKQKGFDTLMSSLRKRAARSNGR